MNKAFKFIVVMVVLLGMGWSLLVTWRFRVLEKRELSNAFRREVTARAVALDREISLNLEVLYAFKSLFSASHEVEKGEFATVAFDAMQRHESILAVAWVPLVGAGQRQALEAARILDKPSFRFHEEIKSDRNESFFPIYFVEPEESFLLLAGRDLGADPAWRLFLEEVRDGGIFKAAGHLKLAGVTTSQAAFWGLLPIYSGNGDTSASRQDNLCGFILGMFDFERLFETSGWSDFRDLSLVRLVDCRGVAGNDELYVYRRGEGGSPSLDLVYEPDMAMAGNPSWRLQAEPVSDYFNQNRSLTPWLFVLAIVLIVSLILLYLWLVARRADSVEKIVSQRTRELDEANRKLASLSLTDGLTGIANRRYFDEHLEQEWKRALRDKQPLSLVMVDIDHFKAYNDYYGHLAGDDCLRQVARKLQTVVARPGDLVARYGGEEFALILPQTHGGAKTLGERCRATVAAIRIPHQASPVKPVVTVSVGVASIIPAVDQDPSRLINAADQALYRAKLLGRNHVVVDTSPVSSDTLSGPEPSVAH
jgi:diguanylate cyclase (GGDEF)-like protein